MKNEKLKKNFCFLISYNIVHTIIFVHSQTSKKHDGVHELDYETNIGDWKRRDIQYCRFPGYDLTYAHYSKFPSWGLQALALTQANQIPCNRLHPLASSHPYNGNKELFMQNAIWIADNNSLNANKQYPVYQTIRADFQRLLIDTKSKEMLTVAISSVLLFINFVIRTVQLLRYYLNEYSPLILFSWWRNKISWELANHSICKQIALYLLWSS